MEAYRPKHEGRQVFSSLDMSNEAAVNCGRLSIGGRHILPWLCFHLSETPTEPASLPTPP